MVALGSTLIDTAKFGSNDVTAFYLGSNEAWTAGEPAELIKPTGIANTGGSASIGTNGQVTFSGVTSLSLNGCFTADFDNYVVSIGATIVTAENLFFRLRASGSDATGSNYTYQAIEASSTSVSASRSSSQSGVLLGALYPAAPSGVSLSVYGSYLAQPTALRSVSGLTANSAYMQDFAATHSLSTAYDGFTIYITNAITGKLAVYGVRS